MSGVISIISAGHSGSTLLDYVVGSIPGVFPTGEVTYLPWQIHRRGGDPPTVSQEEALATQNVCTCLRTFRTCEVWSRIVRHLNEKVGFDIYQDPFRFKIAILTNPRYVRLGERRRRDLLLYRLPRRVTQLAMGRGPLKPLANLARFSIRHRIQNNWLLFDAICEQSGAKFATDCSKDLLRFEMLRSLRPADIRLIVLIREIHGVAYSALKRKRDPIKTAENWVQYYNRIMAQLRRTNSLGYHVVLYRNLTRDPATERRRLADFLDVPDPGDDVQIDTRESHLVAGNPMRYCGRIVIRHDEAWQREMHPDLRGTVHRIAQGLDAELREILEKSEAK